MQEAMQYLSEDFNFTASVSWVNEFKSKCRIRQRKVTRFIKPTEKKSLEQLQENARNFQEECSVNME